MDARESYRSVLEARRLTFSKLERSEDQAANVRLVLFGLVLFAFFALPAKIWLVPAAFFLGALAYHAKIRKRLADARARVAFAERLIRRIEDRWQSEPNTGARFLNPEHLYAPDLDLFGPSSLFQRLNLCRTSGGEERLAEWLTNIPQDAASIERRRARVHALRESSLFREDLAASLEGRADSIQIAPWIEWARQPATLRLPARWTLLLCNLAVGYGAWLWMRGQTSAMLVAAFVIQSLLSLLWKKGLSAELDGIEGRSRELEGLVPVFLVLENNPELLKLALTSETLAPLQSPISSPIRHLGRLVDLIDSRRNPFFAPFALALMWSHHLALACHSWRRKNADRLSLWFDALCEVEALNSLAAYAYENRSDVDAVILTEGLSLSVSGLAHPLLPEKSAVRNDFELGGAQQIVLLSGSNMSGKSTFLRTIGINIVLAYLGVPVRARRCSLSVFQLGCTLRIEDSLKDGRSRFYAELLRLKQILDSAKKGPLCALIDEVLSGTNSKDRVLGAHTVITSLLKHGAIGTVTTHDLALMELETGESRIANFHFEDQCRGRELLFDFVLRPGRLTGSSAQALMRSLGFEIDS